MIIFPGSVRVGEKNEDKSEGQRIAAALGVAASVVAVLAFVGINNLTQLRHFLSSSTTATPTPTRSAFTTSPDAPACTLFHQAQRSYNSSQVATYPADVLVIQAYAAHLNQAAADADDPELRTDLQNLAQDYTGQANALTQGDKSGQLALGNEADSDTVIVDQYCTNFAHVFGA